MADIETKTGMLREAWDQLVAKAGPLGRVLKVLFGDKDVPKGLKEKLEYVMEATDVIPGFSADTAEDANQEVSEPPSAASAIAPEPRKKPVVLDRAASLRIPEIQKLLSSGPGGKLAAKLDQKLCGGRGKLFAVESWIAYNENHGRFGPNAPKGDRGHAIRGFQWNGGSLPESQAKFERSFQAGLGLYRKYVGEPPNDLSDKDEDFIAHLGFIGEDKIAKIGSIDNPQEIGRFIVKDIQVCTEKVIPYYVGQAQESNLFS